ncbi:MAG: TetR/AcrR family transcriptional regulator [Alphaproteobacteria bacterium]|nr:TetR/AcrR family transcriptional regulator [Alphaproteobacteria bacterium]
MRAPSETREKLLKTAIDLVWQSNYCSVGVAEICQRAGVTKGAFYHHFETKADLFYAAAQYHWAEVKPELDAIFSPASPPLEQLENLIGFILTGHQPSQGSGAAELEVAGCPFFAAGGQVSVEETTVRRASQEMGEKSIIYATALVRGLKAEGCLTGDPEPEQTGRMLFTFVQGLLMYGRALNDRAVVEADLRDGMYRLLGLKAAYRRESRQDAAKPLLEPVAGGG